MKKTFPVGNWFPTPVETNKLKSSVASQTSDDNGGESGSTHPFKIVKAGDNDVYVTYGSVGGVVPSQVSSSTQEGTKFSMSGTNDHLYLKITISSNGGISSVNVTKSAPSANNATNSGMLIGSVSVEDGQVVGIGQSLSRSLSLFSCGEQHYWTSV